MWPRAAGGNWAAAPGETLINAYLKIAADGRVTVAVAQAEMGQGIWSALAQIVADELGADWRTVGVEPAPLGPDYANPGLALGAAAGASEPMRSLIMGTGRRVARLFDFQITGGSNSVRAWEMPLRTAGAMARALLVQAAARRWQVDAAELDTAGGFVVYKANRLAFHELLAEIDPEDAPETPELRTVRRLAGQPVLRLDVPAKVDGSARFGIDVRLPGMAFAAIVQGPLGATAAPLGKPALPTGVSLVQTERFVACVADNWYAAHKAVTALPIDWDLGPNAATQQSAINATIKAGLDAEQAAVGNSNGDARQALAGAARKVEAVYAYPHQNHATMEPMNATAKWTPERCEVWTPTQNGEAALAAAAEAAGLPPAQCEVYKIHLGGGFGRRGAVHDWVRQAVAIAKELPGTPVKLLWSREEDMTHGLYHPITQCKMTAGLDAQGNVTALHMRISGQSILAGIFPQNVRDGKDPVVFQGLNNGGGESMFGYTFPHLLIDHAMRNPHVPPGFWRGVNLNQNAVYVECFIDEIAHATGKDPLALRRELMKNHPKHLAVLNAAAERAGWGRPAPDVNGQKVFRGLCQTQGFGSYVAACAEVSVSKDGVLTVHRIVAATDPGYAVNPQQIEAQVEGSFVYGLSAALFGECTVKDGAIEQKNFDSYPVLKMADMPKVETIIMGSGGFWGGVGEPTIAVAAPAVLNAIFAATGKRIRELPLKNQSLKA